MVGWRKASFYKMFDCIPNVILADPYADNFELISYAKGVMSINGTSNFEALCMNKPQLSMARAFIVNCLTHSYLADQVILNLLLNVVFTVPLLVNLMLTIMLCCGL